MLIVIEGCLGAGKSTVAKGLSAWRKSSLLLEDFESHPFLPAFYADPVGNALETEFAFLLLHFHQLKGLGDLSSDSEVVADFHLGKDLLYADLNLKETRAKRLFGELYELCLDTTPRPGLLVCLSAKTELLIERIRARKRDFESDIDPAYLNAINEAYDRFFEGYSGTKLLVRMDDWDFVKNPALFKELAMLVDRSLTFK
jgi:deoxyguanosine kinase